MSKAIELAYQRAQASSFVVLQSEKSLRLEVRDAAILWPDFTGRITQYHKTLGEKRSFNIVLNETMLMTLRTLEEQRGIRFRIHEGDMFSVQDIDTRGCEQFKVHYINVKVNINSAYPPVITLYSQVQDPQTGTYSRSRNTLDGEKVSVLDSATLVTSDCELNIYQSNPESPYVSAYLKKLNAEQEIQLEFGGRWDGWENRLDDDEELPEVGPTEVNPATGEPLQ